MKFSDTERATAVKLLGDKVKGFDDDKLARALLPYAETAVQMNVDLSTSNRELTSQVTELSANVGGDAVTELSARERSLLTRNIGQRIDTLAEKQKWPAAYKTKVLDLCTGSGVIELSATAEPEAPMFVDGFLDILAERPAPGLNTNGSQTTAQTVVTELDRNASDADPTQAASDATAEPVDVWAPFQKAAESRKENVGVIL